jgi:hypothetical protein
MMVDIDKGLPTEQLRAAHQDWLAASKTFMRGFLCHRLGVEKLPEPGELIEDGTTPNTFVFGPDEIRRGLLAQVLMRGMLDDLAIIACEMQNIPTLYQLYYHVWRELRRMMEEESVDYENGAITRDWPAAELRAMLERCEDKCDALHRDKMQREMEAFAAKLGARA